MMQLESSQQHQFPLASSGSDGGNSAAPPRKGSLSVLIDGDMTRFGEFDGCPGISAAFFDRSRHSSFAESNQHQHLHHQPPGDHPEQQPRHEQLQHLHHHHQEHLHGYAPSSDSAAAHVGPDWACSALIEDGAMISYPPESSVAFATADDCSREADANYSVPYFGVPCWVGGHAAPDGLTPLPIDSDPTGSSHSGGGGFGHHFHMDPLEHGKDASSSSLDAPSPAHMEHFMPFVHHGEPEMIFAGMDLSHAEFQNWHLSHQALPHQLEHDQQQHHAMFFPGCAPSDGGDIDQFIPHQHQQHSHNHHQAMLQFDGNEHSSSAIMGLHDKTQLDEDGGSPWRAAGGFHAPLTTTTTTHFIKSDARKNALYHEPADAGGATLKAKARSSATHPSASQRVLRGRSASSAPVAPLPPSSAAAMLNSSAQQKTKSSASSSPFQAELHLVTELNDCYWKNGRKNLQCFPACPEHNDFYSMKMNNRKHSSVGVCRGPVYCHVIAKAAQSLRLGVTTGNGGGSEASGSLPGSSVSSSSSLSSRRSGMASNIHASCAATLPSIPSGQHMKYEHGVGASGSGGSAQELFVLGRFERVPQRDNTDLVEELGDPPEFSSSVAFEQFRYSCFQAVEMKERRTRLGATSSSDRENLPHKSKNENASPSANPVNEDATSTTTATSDSNGDGAPLVRSTWFFLPDVWKVQPMLKKKRKATRSAPAQTFPFCFRVFVYTADGSGGYTCVSSAVSSFFELYSTRTVDRVKRKYWSKSSDAAASSAKRHARE